MMFAKRMKAIEDDVPPVGFIDDGIEEVHIVNEPKSPWTVVDDW
jgi:hypothetical protein